MTAPKSCPGCGGELREIAAVGFLMTAAGRVGYGLCRCCAAKMQNGDEAERTELATLIELALAKTEGEA